VAISLSVHFGNSPAVSSYDPWIVH